MKRLTVLALVLAFGGRAHAELRVAVMEFTNASSSKEMDALGKGLQSMFTTDLSQVQAIQLVERERLHDIEAELKLGRSTLIDKTTAAKIGKLAGATHLFGGSFTIVGSRMRIDGRLFSTQTGEILLAEQVEGDTDTFFDLEKAVVKKVVDAAGIKLQPKERVAVGKVQTADFEAFRKYSEGMAAFDDQRYDEAIAALREATRRDADFALAAATLERYQKVVENLRHKVSDIELAEAREDAAALADGWKAFAAASDPQKKLFELLPLYQVYKNQSGPVDKFARDRGMDRVAQEYFPLAIQLWRDLHAGKRQHRSSDPAPVLSATVLRHYAPKDSKQRNPQLYVDLCLTDGGLVEMLLNGDDYFAGKHLNYDERQIAALDEELTRLGLKVVKESLVCFDQPDDELALLRARLLKRLGQKLRMVLDLKRSNEVLEEAAQMIKDKDELRAITREVEYNRDLAATLATAKDPELVRQLLQGYALIDPKKREELLAGARAFKSVETIDRSFFPNDYLIIGKTPVWLVRGGLSSGPRSDDRHADEIRYYAGAGLMGEWTKKAAAEAVAVVGGQPRAEVRVSFTVEMAPGPDWPASDRGGGRPEVGLVFGLTNVSSSNDPPHGYTLLFGGPTVRLAEITGGEGELTLKVLSEQKLDVSGAGKLVVTVEVGKNAVATTINGKRASFPVPGDHQGFWGLHWRGRGFVAVKALEVGR